MGTTANAINVAVTGTIDPLQVAMAQATQLVAGFMTSVNNLVSAMTRLDASVNKLTQSMSTVGAAAGGAGGHMHSLSRIAGVSSQDVQKAIDVWLLFDRTFRLGLDREMYQILQTYPVIAKVLASLADVPAVFGVVIAFSILRSTIEDAVKGYEHLRDVETDTAIAFNAMSSSIEEQNLELEITVLRLEKATDAMRGITDVNFSTKLQELVLGELKIGQAAEEGSKKIKTMLDDSANQVGWFGSIFGTMGRTISAFWDLATSSGDKAAEQFANAPLTLERTGWAYSNIKEQVRKVDEANAKYDAGLQAQVGDQAKANYMMEHAEDRANAMRLAVMELTKQQKEYKDQGPTAGNEPIIGAYQTAINQYNGLIQQQIGTRQEIQEKAAQQDLEKEKDLLNKKTAAQIAAAAEQKTIALSAINTRETTAKLEYEIGLRSAESLTAAEATAAKERGAAELADLDVRISAARQKSAHDLAAQNELKTLTGERVALIARTEDEVRNIQTKGAVEEQRFQSDKVIAQAAIQQKLTDLDITAEEERVKARASLQGETPGVATREKLAQENARFLAQQTAQQAKMDELSKPGKEKTRAELLEIERLQGEMDAAVKEHENKRAQIVYGGAKETIEYAHQEVDERISAEERLADADIAFQEQRTRAARAAFLIGPKEETAQLVDEENRRFKNQHDAQEARLTDMQRNAGVFKNQIDALNTDIELAEKQHNAKIADLGDSAAADARRRHQQDMELEKAAVEDAIDYRLKMEQQANETRLEWGLESNLLWAMHEKDAAREVYQAKSDELARERTDLLLTRAGDIEGLKKLDEEKLKLDREYELKKRELTQKELQDFRALMKDMESQLNHSIVELLTTRNRWTVIWKEMYNSMLQTALQFFLKEAEQFILHTVIMTKIDDWLYAHNKKRQTQLEKDENAAEKQRVKNRIDANAKILMDDTDTTTAQTAQIAKEAKAQQEALDTQVTSTSTANFGLALSDAALAAAGQFAYYSATDPPDAPDKAAEAYSTGIDWAIKTTIGQFARGGIVPNTGVALVHGGEMVLPRELSQHIMATAGSARTSSPANPNPVHQTTIHYAPTVHASNAKPSDLSKVLNAHADDIGRIVNRQYKKFNR